MMHKTLVELEEDEQRGGAGRYGQDWSLTRDSFDSLLAFIDDDRALASEKYELLRAKLLRFFLSRGCQDPENLTDRAIDRVARRVLRGAGPDISDINGYAYGVARNIFHESVRESERERKAYSGFASLRQPSSAEAKSDEELMRECFEGCLAQLPPESVTLILEYYDGHGGNNVKSRKALAARLGLGLNALRIRAHRIRARVQECISRCGEME